jgi:hypothetical protein
MNNGHAQTPPELVFAPQVPFSWTLRGARTRRLRLAEAGSTVTYRIVGEAVDANEISSLAAFCREHNARLELRH